MAARSRKHEVRQPTRLDDLPRDVAPVLPVLQGVEGRLNSVEVQVAHKLDTTWPLTLWQKSHEETIQKLCALARREAAGAREEY